MGKKTVKDIILEYKGYNTVVRYCTADKVFRGIIEKIKDYVDFQTRNIEDIEKEFHSAVDDYLALCSEAGKEPEKKCTEHLILGEKTILSDPCYNVDIRSNQIVETKPGNYITDFTRTTDEDRIASIRVFHDSIADRKNLVFNSMIKEETMGLGVDSGTMCIADLDYYENMKKNDNKDDMNKLWDATDFYQDNPDYKPYKETDEFQEKIKEICNKYHICIINFYAN